MSHISDDMACNPHCELPIISHAGGKQYLFNGRFVREMIPTSLNFAHCLSTTERARERVQNEETTVPFLALEMVDTRRRFGYVFSPASDLHTP